MCSAPLTHVKTSKKGITTGEPQWSMGTPPTGALTTHWWCWSWWWWWWWGKEIILLDEKKALIHWSDVEYKIQFQALKWMLKVKSLQLIWAGVL